MAVVGLAAVDTDFMIVASLLVEAFVVECKVAIKLKPDTVRVVIEASVEKKAYPCSVGTSAASK